MLFRFRDCELDVDQLRLTRCGEPIGVQPQVFDVLRHLVVHRDRVVAKEELLDTVWGDRFVSESALTSRIKSARRAVGDDGDRQELIRTVHGRGYQFIAPVDVLDVAKPSREQVSSVALPHSRLIGREHDLESVSMMVRERRLVTICGPGGVGKTRLSLHVASRMLEHYAGGVRMVELGAIDPGEDVIGRISSELGVRERLDATMIDRIVESFAAQPVLVVLDNCEHVVEAAGEVADALVRRTAGVAVLATSRRPLGADGEQLWRLSPLPLVGGDGDGESEAAALFFDRMRASAPEVVLDEIARRHADEICRELDGVPLLIELAAARVRHVGLRAVRDSLADPAVLERPSAGPARHRSVDAVIRWSFDRLSPTDRDVFCAVSSFAGWFDLDAAAAVAGAAGDVRPALWRLIDESLVVADVRRSHAPYRLLEPLREFGRRELLSTHSDAAVFDRHAAHVAVSVAAADAALRGPDGAAAMQRLEALVPDFVLAHRTLLDAGRSNELGELVRGMFLLAQEHIRSDLHRTMQNTIDHPVIAANADAVTLAGCAVGSWQRGDLTSAAQLAQRALARAGEGPTAAIAHLVQGQLCQLHGDLAGAHDHGRRSADAAANAGDPVIQVTGLAMCALTSSHRDDITTARTFAIEAARVAEASASPLALSWAAYAAGEIELEDDPERARRQLAEAVRRAEEADTPLLRGTALLSLVSLRCRDDRITTLDEELDEFAGLINHWQMLGMWAHQWATLRNLVVTLARIGQEIDAARLSGATSGPHAPVAAFGAEAKRLDAALRVLGHRLGARRFEELRAEGSALSPNDAVALAIAAARRR
ncbi:MAG TPA: winged helix-turn-helix domain-containing protein [Acidimicrobiales bacterium]|nr:winged helix-turn-helix domain-containing protein [Acidimicrobiales bacterium]